MPIYGIPARQYIERHPELPWPSVDQVANVIFENNTEFTYMSPWYSGVNYLFMVKCETKPRDMSVYGISWEEVDGSTLR